MSATATASRESYVRSLPTMSEAAEFIGLDTGGMTRAVRRLGIEPERWGGRDKHLKIRDILEIARAAHRASLEEVGGSIVEWAEQNHPVALQSISAQIDDYFASLPDPGPAADFVAELNAALPEQWARKAEEIWRAYAGKTK